MKINKQLREYAKNRGLRLVAMSCQTPKGSEMTLEVCVTVEDAAEVCDMFNRILKLSNNADEEGGDDE